MSSFSPKDAERFEALKSRSGLSGNTRIALEMMASSGLLGSGRSYLGVGAGEGELEHVLALDHSARVGYIDPSANLAELFRKRMRESSLESRILDFRVEPAATAKLDHLYHCALAVHSWYYIGYSEAALSRLTRALHPEGSLCVLVHAEGTVIDRLGGKGAGGAVRAEPLLAWVKGQGYRASLESCSEEAPVERYLKADGSFTEHGRNWISYQLRLEADAVPAEDWARCRDVLAAEGSAVAFKYGWLKIEWRDPSGFLTL
jgi:SAM-dependent methyltransferase